jgi:hypothetical protein
MNPLGALPPNEGGIEKTSEYTELLEIPLAIPQQFGFETRRQMSSARKIAPANLRAVPMRLQLFS